MTIYITGATGFAGSWLVRHFAAQAYEVLATGRTAAPGALPERITFQRADICQPLPAVQAEAVIHAAALASDTAPLAKLLATNVEGTKQVYKATLDCPVFIYISSSSVYDNQTSEHREDEPCPDYQRLSAYGRSKRLAEDWLLEQDWSRRTLFILRPRALYGPGDRLLLPRLLRLYRFGRILLPGKMQVSSSLTYAGNLSMAVQHCLDLAAKKPGGVRVFNIADAAPYELREIVVRLLSALHGRDLPVLPLPLPALKMLSNLLEKLPHTHSFSGFGLAAVSASNVLNLAKTKQELSYEPSENFWSVLPDIREWVGRIGLEPVRAGKADLPWTV